MGAQSRNRTQNRKVQDRVEWEALPALRPRKTIVLLAAKLEAPGSGEGSRALEQPSPRTAHGANLGCLRFNSKET